MGIAADNAVAEQRWGDGGKTKFPVKSFTMVINIVIRVGWGR